MDSSEGMPSAQIKAFGLPIFLDCIDCVNAEAAEPVHSKTVNLPEDPQKKVLPKIYKSLKQDFVIS